MSLKCISSPKQAPVPDIHVGLGEKFPHHPMLPGAALRLFLGIFSPPVPTVTCYSLQVSLIHRRSPSPREKGAPSTVRPPQRMPNVSLFPGSPDQSLGITNIFAIGAQSARDDSGKNELYSGYILLKAYLQKQQQARICPRAVVCGLLPPETCRGPCSCPAQTPSSGC